MAAVADDTGLEVDSLGGAPGVRSARFAGDDATYVDNVMKLLDALSDLPEPEERSARFRTVALATFPDGREVMADGAVEGAIALGPRGDNGFGYDPVFVPSEGDGRTFAEMSADEKHAISHRGRAFRALARAVGRSPVTQVDGPLVHDLVTVDHMHALVLRDRRIDVRRNDAHVVAHLRERTAV